VSSLTSITGQGIVNEEEFIQEAQIAIRREDYALAGDLLTKVLKQNPMNLQAWIIAADAAESPEKEAEYLQHALGIQPDLPEIRERLATLVKDTPPGDPFEEDATGPEAEDPFTQGSPAKAPGSFRLLIGFNVILLLAFAAGLAWLVKQTLDLDHRVRTLTDQGIPAGTPTPGSPELTALEHTEEHAALEAATPTPEPIPPPPTPLPPEPTADQSESIAQEATPTPTIDPMLLLPEENQLLANPVPVWSKVETPFPVQNAIPAFGGKYLILQLEEFPALLVYDTKENRIISTLRVGTDSFLYTAGGAAVLVYVPETNMLQTWSLKTFRKIATKPNPKGAIITNLTMGHSTSERALVRYAEGTQPLDWAGTYLLDTVRLLEIPLHEKQHNSALSRHYRDPIHRRADARLHHITEWSSRQYPPGAGLYTITGNDLTFQHQSTSKGQLRVGEDELIYTSTGEILSTNLTSVSEIKGRNLIPSLDSGLLMGISDNGQIQLYTSGNSFPLTGLGTLPSFPKKKNPYHSQYTTLPFTLDRRVVFSLKGEYFVYFPHGEQALYHRTFRLKEILKETDAEYLVVLSSPERRVLPGAQWEYPIQTVSHAAPVSYTLEFGPPGMHISQQGMLSWTAPKTRELQQEKVVVLLEDQKGNRTYHKFELTIAPLSP